MVNKCNNYAGVFLSDSDFLLVSSMQTITLL